MARLNRDMSSEAEELVLFADNDSKLYHQRTLPILANLKKRVAKGKYDPALARKLWAYQADDAAKRYEKEFLNPGEWNKVFPPAVRREAAAHWEAYYRDEIGVTSHDPNRRSRVSRTRVRTPAARKRRVSRARR